MNKTAYWEDEILGALRGTAPAIPSGLYVGLFTACSGDGQWYSEISSPEYTRQQYIPSTVYRLSSGSAIANNNLVIYNQTTASSGWGTVTHGGIFNASVSGNMLYWGQWNIPKPITSGDIVTIAVSGLVIEEL